MCNGITVLNTRYNCMEKIQDNDADIMALDTGQAYFGGRYYNMMPFLAEKYSQGGAGRTISNKFIYLQRGNRSHQDLLLLILNIL